MPLGDIAKPDLDEQLGKYKRTNAKVFEKEERRKERASKTGKDTSSSRSQLWAGRSQMVSMLGSLSKRKSATPGRGRAESV